MLVSAKAVVRQLEVGMAWEGQGQAVTQEFLLSLHASLQPRNGAEALGMPPHPAGQQPPTAISDYLSVPWGCTPWCSTVDSTYPAWMGLQGLGMVPLPPLALPTGRK